MSNTVLKNLLKYGIATLVATAMTIFTTYSYNLAGAATQAERIRILADAFSIPGIVLIMVGFLVIVSNDGFFNGLTYSLTYAIRMLIPGRGMKKMERYYDYVEARSKRPKARSGFLFVVGGIFLVVGLVFTVLFYRV